jgi:hypothetical protein
MQQVVSVAPEVVALGTGILAPRFGIEAIDNATNKDLTAAIASRAVITGADIVGFAMTLGRKDDIEKALNDGTIAAFFPLAEKWLTLPIPTGSPITPGPGGGTTMLGQVLLDAVKSAYDSIVGAGSALGATVGGWFGMKPAVPPHRPGMGPLSATPPAIRMDSASLGQPHSSGVQVKMSSQKPKEALRSSETSSMPVPTSPACGSGSCHTGVPIGRFPIQPPAEG